MAKKWSEVSQSEAFLALPPEQKEAARNQYFDQVVAPQIGDPSQVSVARQQFDTQTRITDLPGVSAAPPDFSDVTSGVTSTEDRARNPANDSAFARMVSGQQAPQEEGNAIGRALGQVGGREVLQGAYGLYGALGGDLLDHYVLGPVDRRLGTNLGTGGRGYRQAASDLADSVGMYRPQTAQDRIYSGVGEALTGTGLTMGIGSGINALANIGKAGAAGVGGSKIGNFLTAQPVLQGVSAATGSAASGAVRESGGSQGQQLAAGLLGGLAPGVAGATGAAALRGAVRGTSGQQMRGNIADFNALGASPSVGQASGNRLIQGAENLLAGGPTSAGVMGRFAERQADDIGGGLQRLADDFQRNASAEKAGRAVQAGVETYGKNVAAQRRALYWDADRHIPAGAGSPMQNTTQTLTSLTTPNPGAVETTGRMVNPKLKQMLDDLQADIEAGGGQVPYEALRKIRTSVGEQMNDFSMTPDTPAVQLRALYSSLSRDMEAVAKAAGPEAERAAKRANNYTRLSSGRLEHLQGVVDKAGGGEAVYNAVLAGSKDGGTRLREVMQSLPKGSQEALTAAVIKRMGMPTAGQAGADAAEQFSAATFLTNWNRVSPEARRALFDRHGPEFSRNMDRIASVADNLKSGAKVFANPSGTANRAAAMTYGASLVASMFDPTMATTATLLATGAGANGVARVLTSPRAVRWLARATKAPKGSIIGMANAMHAEARQSGDGALEELAEYFKQAVDSSPAGNQQENRQ